MTYREAPIREPIDPPWGRHRGLGRGIAYSLFGAGGAGALALLAFGDPVLAIAAIVSSSGIGLSFLFGGGGEKQEPAPREPQGPEEPLRRAGLRPVGWTEWRAVREGFPVRILYSALTARVRIEVALGSAPTFGVEIDAPPEVEVGGLVVGNVRVRSDQPETARSVVTSALRRTPDVPSAFALRLDDRVLRTRLTRSQTPSGYETVIAALDITLGVAQAMAAIGQGLPPFRRS